MNNINSCALVALVDIIAALKIILNNSVIIIKRPAKINLLKINLDMKITTNKNVRS